MHTKTTYICDFCCEEDEDEDYISRHEEACNVNNNSHKEFGHLTIGELLQKAEGLPNIPVVISSGEENYYNGMGVLGAGSYRGFYNELAIHPASSISNTKKLISDLRYSLRVTHVGYRGGEYSMSEGTFVWVDFPGEANSFAVTDLVLDNDLSGLVLRLKVKKLFWIV